MPAHGTNQSTVPTWTSCRYMLAYIAFIGFILVYAVRFNFSVAIVCMVDKNSTTSENATESTLDWSREQQGHLLSAFFYGYLVTQIPGGFLADKYGGKRVFVCGMCLSCIATLLTPLAALTDYGFVIACRFLIGLGTGVVFPCATNIWAKWAPVFERTKLITFTFSGSGMGSVLAYFLSGFMCDSMGWPSVFYFAGGFGLLWCLIWIIGVYGTPSEHPLIKQVELDFIQEHLPKVTSTFEDHRVPWLKILKSLPVWAICAAHSSTNWMGYTLYTCIPMYMNDVLQFDIKSSGYFSAIPYIVSLFTMNMASFAADKLRSSGVRTVLVRKLLALISCIVSASMMVAVGFLDADQSTMAVVFLVICAVGLSISKPGYAVNHVDIAPRYAGLLFGISNSFSTVAGIVAPVIVGVLTTDRTREQWQIVFGICAALSVAGNAFFLIFAKGEIQEWAKPKPADENNTGEMDSL